MESFEIVELMLAMVHFYVGLVMLSYAILILFSRLELIKYSNRTSKNDWQAVLTSERAPTISLIAPAYNEGATILENVRSMLSLHYKNLEIIVINDGSKDDTLEKLITHYSMIKVMPPSDHSELSTQLVRGIYRSTRSAFNKLTVIDKENGGKADSLNAGINYAKSRLVACIDVDCILEKDSLLKMVKPFLENPNTIAVGGVIRIANDAQVKGGSIRHARLSKNLLARFQHLEYLRSFLIGRMAWSRLNGLMLISGAFGLFNKDTVISCGGYDPKTVGEDMELVVRLRKYMHKIKRPFVIKYIPESLCWTEVPGSLDVLSKQRNRWARGATDTLFNHREMIFNKKYDKTGWISYPYWVLLEWFAPIGEFLGLIFFTLMACFGLINFTLFFQTMIMIYCFSICLSVTALYLEEKHHFAFTNRKDTYQLLVIALLEPIIYHPLTVWWTIRGNLDYLLGKRSWGEMKRKGFSTV